MRKLLVIAALAALASLSFGQGRMFMMGGRGGGSGLQLAMRDDVAKELGLTAEQKTKLQDAADARREEMRAQFRGGGPGGPGGGDGNGPDRAEMEKMMKEMRDKENKILGDILSADQIKRLKELRIQRSGNNAIMDPEVQSALKMTDAQKKQVSDLQEKQMEAGRTLFEKMQNQEIDRDEMRSTMEKNGKIMSDELAKILTADQKKQLADMGGKPFKFDESLDNQRGPGGR